MTVYGIDPSADDFVVSAYPPTGTPAATFENTAAGVTAFAAGLPGSGVVVAVENTGVYSEALCYALHGAGVPLVLLDPGAIHRAFPGTPKTDALDAAKVAEYGHRFADRLARWRPHADAVEQVRVLLATREQLVGQRTAASNARRAFARKPVQVPAATDALDSVVAHLRAQVRALEGELRRVIAAHPTLSAGVDLLVGVPGVGLLLASQMAVLTSGFTEPAEYRPLAQRLGIAPNAHESGRTVRRRPRSRGYGEAAARKLLYMAARSVRTHNADHRAYFEAKVVAGKPPTLVLNNVSNRILRVMCGVLRTGRPYRPDYVGVGPVPVG